MKMRRPSKQPRPAAKSGGCASPLLNSAEVDEVYRRLAAVNPEPRGELAFTDPFTLLVAVVLSAQATDASVNRACAPLFAVAPTPAAMLALGEEGLRERIKTIGLFNTKARNVIALSRQLIERWGGVVPRDREALQALPGVGRKSANVVLNVAFGEPTIAVDTHVFRVANRTGLATGMTPEAVEQGLLARTPERWLHHAHHWLILHGRYICQARKPRCFACPIRDVCRYPAKTEGVDLAAAGVDPLASTLPD
jgi:endonuclease-3